MPISAAQWEDLATSGFSFEPANGELHPGFMVNRANRTVAVAGQVAACTVAPPGAQF